MTDWVVPPDCPLSARQLQVLAWIGSGRSYGQAAEKMGLKETTVRTHVHNACKALGVPGSVAACMACFRRGWFGWRPGTVPPPDKPGRATRFERAYLDAFDEHLRTRSEGSRDAMSIALLGMRNDRGVAHRATSRPVDPLERLARALLRWNDDGPPERAVDA